MTEQRIARPYIWMSDQFGQYQECFNHNKEGLIISELYHLVTSPFSFAISRLFRISFQSAHKSEVIRSSHSMASSLRSSSTQELGLPPNFIDSFPLLVETPHYSRSPPGQSTFATLNGSVCFKHQYLLQWTTFWVLKCDDPGPILQRRSGRQRFASMPGNKVQDEFTDLSAQLRVRSRRQTHHASVLTFYASRITVQQNIVRRRM
jgi:hypothetical protein